MKTLKKVLAFVLAFAMVVGSISTEALASAMAIEDYGNVFVVEYYNGDTRMVYTDSSMNKFTDACAAQDYIHDKVVFKLTCDLEPEDFNEPLQIPNTVNGEIEFDLNGHNIETNQRLFTIQNGTSASDVTVTLKNSGADGGNITMESGASISTFGGCIYVGNYATLNLEDGVTISGYDTTNSSGGSAIGVNSGATFNMNGGTITNCSTTGASSSNGGAVRIASSNNNGTADDTSDDIPAGTFNMSGGTISAGSATTSGRGLGVCNKGIFNLTGGELTGFGTTWATSAIYNDGSDAICTIYEVDEQHDEAQPFIDGYIYAISDSNSTMKISSGYYTYNVPNGSKSFGDFIDTTRTDGDGKNIAYEFKTLDTAVVKNSISYGYQVEISDYACKIVNGDSETYYYTVDDALTHATDGTTAVVLTANYTRNITVPSTANGILDLNGYTVSGNIANTAEGTCIITDNSDAGTGTVSSTITTTDSTTNITGGTFTGAVTATTISGGTFSGAVTAESITGGTFTSATAPTCSNITGGYFVAEVTPATGYGLYSTSSADLGAAEESIPDGCTYVVHSLYSAKIGSTSYLTLQGAINAVPNTGSSTYITLLRDITLDDGVDTGSKKTSRRIYLDLAGFDITNTSADSTITIRCIFTINDSVGGGKICSSANRDANGTALYLNGAKANLTLNAGTIDGSTSTYTSRSTVHVYNSATLNIKGGTVSGLVYAYTNGVINMTDGTVDKLRSNDSTATISGGTISENGSLVSNTAGGITITGGNIGATTLTGGDTGLILFEGGIYTASNKESVLEYANANGGGINYAMEDYTEGTDPFLFKLTTNVCQVGETTYATIANAISAIANGSNTGTITLISNAEEDVVISDPNLNVKIDLAGHTLDGTIKTADGCTTPSITLELNGGTLSTGSERVIDVDCNLTIQDSSDDADGVITSTYTSYIISVDGTLTMTSGKITASAGDQQAIMLGSSATAEISGGRVEGALGGSGVYTISNAQIAGALENTATYTISSGYFKNPVLTGLADGCICEADSSYEGCNYVVKDDRPIIAYIGDEPYRDIDVAISACGATDTIVVVDGQNFDDTTQITIPEGKIVTIQFSTAGYGGTFTNNGTVTIIGTVTCNGTVVNNGTYNAESGTYTGSFTNNGTLNISGGTYASITNEGTLTQSSGTVTALTNDTLANASATATISGGYVGGITITDSAVEGITVSGGYFTTRPSNSYLAADYKVKLTGETPYAYSVVPATDVCTVTNCSDSSVNKGYITVELAIAAIKASSATEPKTATITMTDDYVVESTIAVDESLDITLDLNGHTLDIIEREESENPIILNSGTLVLKDDGGDSAGYVYGNIENDGVLDIYGGHYVGQIATDATTTTTTVHKGFFKYDQHNVKSDDAICVEVTGNTNITREIKSKYITNSVELSDALADGSGLHDATYIVANDFYVNMSDAYIGEVGTGKECTIDMNGKNITFKSVRNPAIYVPEGATLTLTDSLAKADSNKAGGTINGHTSKNANVSPNILIKNDGELNVNYVILNGGGDQRTSSADNQNPSAVVYSTGTTTIGLKATVNAGSTVSTSYAGVYVDGGSTLLKRCYINEDSENVSTTNPVIYVASGSLLGTGNANNSGVLVGMNVTGNIAKADEASIAIALGYFDMDDMPSSFVADGSVYVDNSEDNSGVYPYKIVGEFEAINLNTGVTYQYAQDAINEASNGDTIQQAMSIRHDGLVFGGTYTDDNSVEHTRATNINYDLDSWSITVADNYDSETEKYSNDAPVVTINAGCTVHIYSSRQSEDELGYFTNMISTCVAFDDNGEAYNVVDGDLTTYATYVGMERSKATYAGCGAGIYNAGTLAIGGSYIDDDGETQSSSAINIVGCFTDGAVGHNGGGIYNASTGTVVLDNVNIGADAALYSTYVSSRNDASEVNGAYRGGAIYNDGGTMTVKNSTIRKSMSNAVMDGGLTEEQNGEAVYVNAGGKLTLSNTSIYRHAYQSTAKTTVNVYGTGSTITMKDGKLFGRINVDQSSGAISYITGGKFGSYDDFYSDMATSYTKSTDAKTAYTNLSHGYLWTALDTADVVSETLGSYTYTFNYTPEVLCVARITDGSSVTQYRTLQLALDAVNHSGNQRTVELLCDISGEDAVSGLSSKGGKYVYVIDEGQDIVIDLNGHTLTETGYEDSSNENKLTFFSIIRNNGTLTIKDSIGGGAITMGDYNEAAVYPSNGGGIYNRGVLTLESGTITKCYTTGTISSDAEVTGGGDLQETEEGDVEGTTTDKTETVDDIATGGGAGVYNASGTSRKFIMNGGSIEYCEATNNKGGGVYVSSESTFIMNDGTITQNKAYGNGGGIHTYCVNEDGKTSDTQTNKTYVFMYGGTISYNYAGHMATLTDGSKTSTGNGGAICISSDCIFYMYGGSLYRNRAYQYGGGVNIGYNDETDHYGEFYMYGLNGNTPTINQNQVLSNGGGVYCTYEAQMGVWGSIIVYDNHSMPSSNATSKFLDTTDYTYSLDNNLFLKDDTIKMDGPLTTTLESGSYTCATSTDGKTYVEGTDQSWYYTTAEGYTENYSAMSGWDRSLTMITLPNYTEVPIYQKTFSSAYKYVDSNGDVQTGRTPGTYYDNFKRYTTEDTIDSVKQTPVVDTDYYRFDVIAGREDWDFREVPLSGTAATDSADASTDYDNIIYVFMAEIDSASVTLANELAINYYCSITKTKYEMEKSGDVMLLYVNINSESELIKGELITDNNGNPAYLTKADPISGEDVDWVQWRFTFNGIDPCWMADDIESAMYIGVKVAGTADTYKRTSKRLTDENTYSIAEYCNDLYKAIYAAEQSGENLSGYSVNYSKAYTTYYTSMKSLLADILMYGKAAQEFRHYEDGSVATVPKKLCTQVDWGYVYDGRGDKAERILIDTKTDEVPTTTYEDAPAWIYWDTVCWTSTGSNTIIDEKDQYVDWEWIQEYTTANDYDQDLNQYGGTNKAYDTSAENTTYFQRATGVEYVAATSSDNIYVNYEKNSNTSGLLGDASEAEVIGLYTMFGVGGYVVPRICFNADDDDVANGYIRIKVLRQDPDDSTKTLTEYYEAKSDQKFINETDGQSYYYVELGSNYDDDGVRNEDFLFYPQQFGDKFTINLQIQTSAGKWRSIHATDYSINSYCCQWIDMGKVQSKGDVTCNEQGVLMSNLAYATLRYGKSIARLVDAIANYSES